MSCVNTLWMKRRENWRRCGRTLGKKEDPAQSRKSKRAAATIERDREKERSVWLLHKKKGNGTGRRRTSREGPLAEPHPVGARSTRENRRRGGAGAASFCREGGSSGWPHHGKEDPSVTTRTGKQGGNDESRQFLGKGGKKG